MERFGKWTMRLAIIVVGAAIAVGCGGAKAPPAEAPTEQATSQPTQSTANDPSRRLTKSECESLSATIVDACNNRGNDRSTEADGWCSDMVQRNADGTWVASDCAPHFRFMDRFCFQAANNAHGMMICDRTVDRTR